MFKAVLVVLHVLVIGDESIEVISYQDVHEFNSPIECEKELASLEDIIYDDGTIKMYLCEWR